MSGIPSLISSFLPAGFFTMPASTIFLLGLSSFLSSVTLGCMLSVDGLGGLISNGGLAGPNDLGGVALLSSSCALASFGSATSGVSRFVWASPPLGLSSLSSSSKKLGGSPRSSLAFFGQFTP